MAGVKLVICTAHDFPFKKEKFLNLFDYLSQEVKTERIKATIIDFTLSRCAQKRNNLKSLIFHF